MLSAVLGSFVAMTCLEWLSFRPPPPHRQPPSPSSSSRLSLIMGPLPPRLPPFLLRSSSSVSPLVRLSSPSQYHCRWCGVWAVMGVMLPFTLSLSLSFAVASAARSLHSSLEYNTGGWTTQHVLSDRYRQASAHTEETSGEGEREWPLICDH